MNQEPQSSQPPRRVPSLLWFLAILQATVLGAVQAQAPDRTTGVADLLKEATSSSVVLGQVMQGAAVTFGEASGEWREVTLEGWVAANAVQADRRDGFDVSIALSDGARLRTSPSSSASVRAFARFGALFDRLETRGSWVHLRRQAWIPVAATVVAPDIELADTATAIIQPEVPDSGAVTLRAGRPFSGRRSGAPIGELEIDTEVELLERVGGWNRVAVELWVPDEALSGAEPTEGISGAMVLAEPDRYLGEPVTWTLQYLAVRVADELRPELPLGQPYVLTRGPMPETGFVYLVVSEEERELFEQIQPLAEIRVRATIRAGRTRHLPTPVLNLVRILD